MSDDYTPPTPEEVRSILSALGLTGAEAAKLIGLSSGRQIRKYTGGQEPKHMSFANLYTLLHRSACLAITPAGWRLEASHLLLKSGFL